MASNDITTATATPQAFVFPGTAEPSRELVVPPAPASTTSTELVKVVVGKTIAEAQQTLDCYAILSPEEQQQAHQIADELYPQMVGSRDHAPNTSLVLTYGTSALDGVNRVVDKMLAENSDVKVPELLQSMKELNRRMRDIQRGWDTSDPQVAERLKKLAQAASKGKKWWRAGRTWLDDFRDDITSMESHLNNTEEVLSGGMDRVLRNITSSDQLYLANEQGIRKIIFVVGVMELLYNRAVDEASAIEVTEAFGDRSGEDKSRLVAFAQTMQMRIASNKGRLFVAWTTAPNLRQQRMIQEGVVVKVNETIYNGLPVMRLVLAQWRAQAKALEVSMLTDLVNAQQNEWLIALDRSSTATTQQLAAANATPALAPATVAQMAKGIADRAEIIIAAMEQSFVNYDALEASIVQGKQAINQADDRLTTEFVERYVERAFERNAERKSIQDH